MSRSHDWQPDSGFCKQCGLGFAQVSRDSRLGRCEPNVVGIGLRAVKLIDGVVTGNWRQFNAWLPTDDGGAA